MLKGRVENVTTVISVSITMSSICLVTDMGCASLVRFLTMLLELKVLQPLMALMHLPCE